jgi:hypothetical protein
VSSSSHLPQLLRRNFPRRIEGAPNFRRIPLVLQMMSDRRTPSASSYFALSLAEDGKNVCGRLVHPVIVNSMSEDDIVSKRNANSPGVRSTLTA